jgi:hypothetical protein
MPAQFPVNGVLPGRPLECLMEESLVAFLRDQFTFPGYFLENCAILAGHRDRRQIITDPAEQDPDQPAKSARRVQIVVWADNHRETYDDAPGTDKVDITIEILTHLRQVPGGQTTHDAVVQGMRALMSASWSATVRAALNADTAVTGMSWQGWHRDPDDGARTAYSGDQVATATTYQASGYLIPTPAPEEDS